MTDDFRDFIERTLRESSAIARKYFGNVTATTKLDDNNQVLTEADIEIGKYVVEAIAVAYPDHSIIDEEAGVIDRGSKFIWVVDPIEATSNFACGTEEYAVMIGLLKNDEPYAGGIILPSKNVVYLAQRGAGATKNGDRISVTQETDPLRMLVSYGIDSQRNVPENTVNECRVLADIVLSVRNVRNSGCEGVDPMYVAEGKYGGRINCASKIWDNVAPQIIVEEAGGVWTDTNGRPIDYSNAVAKVDQNFTFCTGSPEIHRQLVSIIDGRL